MLDEASPPSPTPQARWSSAAAATRTQASPTSRSSRRSAARSARRHPTISPAGSAASLPSWAGSCPSCRRCCPARRSRCTPTPTRSATGCSTPSSGGCGRWPQRFRWWCCSTTCSGRPSRRCSCSATSPGQSARIGCCWPSHTAAPSLGRAHPLGEVLADLHRLPGVERIALEGLAADDVAALVADELHRSAADVAPLAAAIQTATTGNPYFVLEPRALTSPSRGGRSTRSTARHFAVIGLREEAKPCAARRVGRLASRTRTALDTAAVIGDDIEIGVLINAVDLDEDELLGALDEAVSAGILVEVSGVDARPTGSPRTSSV